MYGSILIASVLLDYEFISIGSMLASTVSFQQFSQILIISYSYKIIFDLLAVIPASFLARFLKHVEGLDIYDFPKRFTPAKYAELKRKFSYE